MSGGRRDPGARSRPRPRDTPPRRLRPRPRSGGARPALAPRGHFRAGPEAAGARWRLNRAAPRVLPVPVPVPPVPALPRPAMPIRAHCTICSDFFDNERDVAAVPCGHTFHRAW